MLFWYLWVRWRPVSLVYLSIVLFTIFLTSHGASASPRSDIYAFLIAPENLSGFGITFALDRVRASSEDVLLRRGIRMHSKFIEDVKIEDCVSTATAALAEGLHGMPYDVWLIGHPAYVSCATEVAKDPRFANLTFLSIAGQVISRRTTMYLMNTFEARFLHGYMCAMVSKTGNVGFVAPDLTVMEYTTSAAAFVAGTQLAAKNTTVLISLTDERYGGVGERKSTEDLIDRDVDCLVSTTFTLAPNQLAADMGVWTASMFPFARFAVGEQLLVNIFFEWVSHVSQDLRDLAYGNYTPSVIFLNSTTGSVVIEGFSTRADPLLVNSLHSVLKRMTDNELEVFCEPHFKSPLLSSPALTKLNNGIRCLNTDAIWGYGIYGVPYGAHVISNYNATNSPFTLKWIPWNSLVAIILVVLCSLLIIAVLLSCLSLYFYREQPAYRSASPLFLVLILVALLLGIFNSLVWIGRPSKVSCVMTYWLLGSSLGLMYSCILAKNWRIWKIFSSGSFKRVAISNRNLLLSIVLPLMALEYIVLLFLTLWRPPIPTISRGPHLDWDENQLMCRPRDRHRFGVILFSLYQLLLLVPCAFISYKTMGASQEYRESTSIALVIYSSIVVEVLIPGINFAMPGHYMIAFYSSAYGIWVLMAAAWIGIFAPKLYIVHIQDKSSTTQSAAPQLSTHNSNPKFESLNDKSITTWEANWLDSQNGI